jgi:hypothetical protein
MILQCKAGEYFQAKVELIDAIRSYKSIIKLR